VSCKYFWRAFMKITKQYLKQIIKEELKNVLQESPGKKYCCYENPKLGIKRQPFQTVVDDRGGVWLRSCDTDGGCTQLDRLSIEEFDAKLKSGEFKPI